jgi:hypothetical protein
MSKASEPGAFPLPAHTGYQRTPHGMCCDPTPQSRQLAVRADPRQTERGRSRAYPHVQHQA